VGGGLEIAALCDLRICGTSSRFGAPIKNLGLVMAYAEMAPLIDLVGTAVTLELLLDDPLELLSRSRGVKRKLGIARVMDLSATPFFLRGSGYKEGMLFPWVVSDFSLIDAIESGIVKVPRVPVEDNAMTGEQPTYRDLWPRIREDLPKKGRKGDAGGGEPHLPAELEGASDERKPRDVAPLFAVSVSCLLRLASWLASVGLIPVVRCWSRVHLLPCWGWCTRFIGAGHLAGCGRGGRLWTQPRSHLSSTGPAGGGGPSGGGGGSRRGPSRRRRR
jgi:hypothetical protein